MTGWSCQSDENFFNSFLSSRAENEEMYTAELFRHQNLRSANLRSAIMQSSRNVLRQR